MCLLKFDQLKFDQHPVTSKNVIERKVALSPARLATQYAEVLWLREQVRIYEMRQGPRRARYPIFRSEAKCDRSVGEL
jgi:hypothetical protein